MTAAAAAELAVTRKEAKNVELSTTQHFVLMANWATLTNNNISAPFFLNFKFSSSLA